MAREDAGVTVIVDGANVMGSRADGWWRDRAGAMARLYGELVDLATCGVVVPADSTGEGSTGEGSTGEGSDGGVTSGGAHPTRIILVVEGKARAVLGLIAPGPAVEVVAAPGHGDDEIAALAGSVPGRRIAVTADQELRRRCSSAGAEVAGPRWLTGQFPPRRPG